MTLTLDPARLRAAVRSALDVPDAELATWESTESGHRIENMTTRSLLHVRGTLTDGTPWRLFVKVLHPASQSPVWQLIPSEFQDAVERALDWRDEPRVYASGLDGELPPGLRLPRVHRIDVDDSAITLWLEDVDDHGCWDAARYAAAAHTLGAMAGRVSEARVRELGLGRRDLAFLFHGRVTHAVLPALQDPALWAAPELSEAQELRGALDRLADAAPALIARCDALPHGLGHGDASPANLLSPAGDGLVAVDWSYGSAAPYGSDLAQLLAGRAVEGVASPGEPEDVRELALAPFLEGLASEGVEADPEGVELAWATHLLVRSGFSALVIERPDLDATATAALRTRRLPLARIAVELASRHL